ncbi:c-type cytochrome [Pusillimonas sp. SM2304]|uniref:c-type cytochrome n=1 Tax=Pusillimonas sp. SM2304 TaxID=3073241 RepID=UPI002876F952|nr:c-type cytochrome [Pusillimonas sp. SM2304]MDS1139734.1 c-type cytochrome [Pusillimonas sp. SM2304]
MKTWKRVAGITLTASAASAALLGGLFVYSGVYDVSATDQHTAPVYHLLETSLRRSVKLRTSGTEVPNLEDTGRVVAGFKLFRSHCVQCHGAPGIAPQPFALGLTPAPASLVASAQEWTAAETHWIIRRGIKMSGMPAWQYRMSDEEIWDVVAFMKVLPTLSPADYARWSREHAETPSATPQAPITSAAQEARLGDAGAGKKALQQYLCATCHAIPGVVGADKHVGPPLAGIANRQYIAGVLPNTPANMLRWLRKPTGVDPLSAMPDLGVSEQDARDIAAFLYTLREPQ